MGSSNENSAFGPVRNPVALDRVPGGSSGGSAAAVAQGTAVVALGSDTGGSVRQPASFCGVVGVTPTYGRVSRYGLAAFASSLDHIGPFRRAPYAMRRRCCGVDRGPRRMDATSAFAPVPDYAAALDGNVKGMKIGLPREYFEGLSSETGDLILKRCRGFEEAGLRGARDQPAGDEVRDRLLLHHRHGGGQFQPGALRRRALHDARRAVGTLSDMYRRTRGEGFGAECKRRIMLGTYVLSAGYYDAYYLKAQKVRALIARRLSQSVRGSGRDRGAGVALPGVQDGRKGGRSDGDVSFRYLHHHRRPGGHPVHERSVRQDRGGLPVGLQILTRHFDETGMFRLADAFETAQQAT